MYIQSSQPPAPQSRSRVPRPGQQQNLPKITDGGIPGQAVDTQPQPMPFDPGPPQALPPGIETMASQQPIISPTMQTGAVAASQPALANVGPTSPALLQALLQRLMASQGQQ